MECDGRFAACSRIFSRALLSTVYTRGMAQSRIAP